MTDEEMTKEYIAEYGFGSDCNNLTSYDANQSIEQAFLAGLKVGRPKWHKLDWKQDYPELNRLVRVRTQSGEEYICETYVYQPTEDEIGYGTILTQFEQLNGDWVDDNEIEYWCYIEPFKEISLCF